MAAKTTRPAAATAASKVLRDRRFCKTAKIAAGSALSQVEKRRTRKVK